jgi:hypothetical protein
MTHLYNGALMDKFKHPLPNQNSVIRSLARGHKSDTNNLEYEVDNSKMPLPIDLLKHEIDTDTQLQDTLLNICDKDGMPLKFKLLCDTLDDVREIIETEEFFNQIPMCEEFSYFVARDWIGRPISKFELNSIERQRRIFEKRALKKRQQYETRKKKMEKHKPKIQIKDAITTLTF